MADLPCKNPNCSSHGQPHPNCRCYGGMAEGGEVSNYCDTNQPHEEGCEYYAEGGGIEIPQGFEVENETAIPEGYEVEEHHENPYDKYLISNPANRAQEDEESRTAGEGVARGLSGTLSDVVLPGARERAEQHPDIAKPAEMLGLGAGLLTGTGVPGLATKGAGAATRAIGLGAEGAGALSKIGATALKGALESGMLQGTDELSKAMLGEKGSDPTSAVSRALGIGGILGVLTGAGGVGLNKLGESKMGERATKALEEYGSRWNVIKSPPKPGLFTESADIPKPGSHGEELADATLGTIDNLTSPDTASKAAEEFARKHFGTLGTVTSRVLFLDKLAPIVAKVVGRPLNSLGKAGVSAALKVLGEGDSNAVYKALDYAKKVNDGERLMNGYVDSLFKTAKTTGIKELNDKDNIEKLRKWIDNGGIAEDLEDKPSPLQEFAHGGKVDVPKSNTLEKHFPDQNMLLNSAKARVSNYLQSVKPQPANKLPFDRTPVMDRQKHSYENALKIAANPLSIMNSVKKGNLSFDQMKHFSQMYPEIHDQLSKKITSKIMESQLKGEKPSYKTRQSMSLFLGTPLDSTMSPQSIMAAQSTFIPRQQPQQQAQQQPQGKSPKRGTSTLGKSNNSYKTTSQAAESDRSNRT